MKKRPEQLNPSLLTRLSVRLLLTLVACGPGGGGPGTDTTPPGVPGGLKAMAGNQLVNLNWSANTESDLKGYTLMYGTSANSLTQSVTVEKTKVAQTVNQLTNGTPYYFALKAQDTAGDVSALSSTVSATLQAARLWGSMR